MPVPLRLLVLCVAVAAAWVPDNSTALPHFHNASCRRPRRSASPRRHPPAASSSSKSGAGGSLGSALVLAFRVVAVPGGGRVPAPGGVVAAAPVGPAAGARAHARRPARARRAVVTAALTAEPGAARGFGAARAPRARARCKRA